MTRCVLGICGWKNSGKTTLIERLIPPLIGKGLAVAVVKHDTHGIEMDRPGKDSFRFFEAGADVVLQGPGEAVRRCHEEETGRLRDLLDRLVPRYDLILVEGHKGTPLPKVWLGKGEGEGESRPSSVENVLLELPLDAPRKEAVLDFLDRWLPARWAEPPLFGCLLFGGMSRRMGRPKHLLRRGEETWIERIARIMGEVVDEVVLAGAGDLPGSLASLKRLPDSPEVEGPLSGMIAAMRWHPGASWIVAACDMPFLTPEAIEWLAARRQPGIWAVVPSLEDRADRAEPLLACYDFRARPVLEAMARRGDYCVQRIANFRKTVTPRPPREIAAAWTNCNELEDIDGEAGPGE